MKTRESTFWTWHLLAGVIILVVLGIHMSIMHLSKLLGTGGGTNDVVQWTLVRMRSIDFAFAFMYVVLLGAALYHGLYGLRTIILELTLPERAERFVSGLIVFIGFVLFILGGYSTVAFYVVNGPVR